MSLKAILWAFDQDIPSTVDKFVLVAMANFVGDTGLSYPSLESVCDITSIKKTETISNAIKSLIENGYIKDTGQRCGRTGQIKIYQFPEICYKKMQSPPGTDSFLKDPQSHRKDSGKEPRRLRLAELPYIRNLELELEPEQEVGVFDVIKSGLDKLFKREGRRWNYDEEHLLLEICKDKNAADQFNRILGVREKAMSKGKNFFPLSVQAVLQGWSKLLDSAAALETELDPEKAKRIANLKKQWK